MSGTGINAGSSSHRPLGSAPRAAFVRQPPSCQITKMVTGVKEIIRKLAPVGVWVFLNCYCLIVLDQDYTGLLPFYVGVASTALAGIMFLGLEESFTAMTEAVWREAIQRWPQQQGP